MVPGKSIAVMGGDGFIGSNLVKDLNCTSITKSNYTEIGKNYDVFINANGNSKKQLPETDPLTDFDLTVRNTMKSIIDFKYDMHVYISSCEVSPYEDFEQYPFASRYGFSKYLAELLVQKYCKKWLIIRLNGPIGPGMKKGPVYDIMNGNRLWISSESKFQLIHTKYISKLISEILKIEMTNEIINLTGSGTVGMKEIMTMFGKNVEGPESPIIKHSIDVRKANRIMSIPSSYDSIKEL